MNDYERVWKGSPWSFNMKLLALTPLSAGDYPETIMTNAVPFWVQAFGVSLSYVSTNICEAIGNFIGTYLDVDKNNFKISCPAYLRVRVLIDISKPIKQRMRVKINAGQQLMLQFRCERLPSFCMIYGMFQHRVFLPAILLKEWSSPKAL